MANKSYDVFLSFNSEDRDEVEQIAKCLEDKIGIKPWFDQWALVPGEDWMDGLAQGIKKSSVCAVFIGKSGKGPWQDKEVKTVLINQAKNRKFRVIPVLLPDASKRPKLPPFLTVMMWVDFRNKGLNDENTLWRLECGIRGIPPGKGIKKPRDNSIMNKVKNGQKEEKKFSSIEFINRFNEIQFITNIYCPPYLLINAPAGYGKSRLIENVKERLQQQKWLCVHLKLARERVYSIENLAADILQQFGEKQNKNPDAITPEKAGAKVATCILKALKNDHRNILLLIDEAEVLDDKVAKQLLNECIPSVKEGLNIAAVPIKLRIICAGRHLAHWKQLSSKLPLELMSLTSFDLSAVSETVEKFSITNDVKANTEYKQDFAAHLMYFTGGHPGCMSNILEKDYGSPINLLVSNAKEYYEAMITPVIEEIREHIPIHLREIFEKLSVFRMYNYPLLQNILDVGIITYQGNAVSLEGELTATYLVERKYGFIQDDIVRRLLAMRLRQEQGPKAFGELCGSARQIIRKYLQKTTYQPHSVALEGLYQELQYGYYQTDQTLEARQVLSEKFFAQDGILQTYLNLLAKKRETADTLANFQQILQSRKDWELQFTLNFFLRKDPHYTDEPYQRLLREVEQFIAPFNSKSGGH